MSKHYVSSRGLLTAGCALAALAALAASYTPAFAQEAGKSAAGNREITIVGDKAGGSGPQEKSEHVRLDEPELRRYIATVRSIARDNKRPKELLGPLIGVQKLPLSKPSLAILAKNGFKQKRFEAVHDTVIAAYISLVAEDNREEIERLHKESQLSLQQAQQNVNPDNQIELGLVTAGASMTPPYDQYIADQPDQNFKLVRKYRTVLEEAFVDPNATPGT